jgi:hypothetical protein
VEDVGLSGLVTIAREDENFSLICIRAGEESAVNLAFAAQRIRQNIRRDDTVLLFEGECECVIILPRTSLADAQVVARRLALLLIDVECELELLYGLAAHLLLRQLLAGRVIEVPRQELVESVALEPARQQSAESEPELPYLPFLADYPPRRLFRLFPYDLACQYRCVPVGAERDMLTLGTRERLDEHIIAHFRQVTKRGIFQVRCDERLINDVLRYWQRLYEVEAMFN